MKDTSIPFRDKRLDTFVYTFCMATYEWMKDGMSYEDCYNRCLMIARNNVSTGQLKGNINTLMRRYERELKRKYGISRDTPILRQSLHR